MIHCNAEANAKIVQEMKEYFDCIPHFNERNEEGEILFPLTIEWSEKPSNILLIAGANASGKSVLGEVIESISKEIKFEKRSVCMRNRTTSGFASAMIFGDESTFSTGYNTIGAVNNGLNSSIGASRPAVMILDEPDLGLAEESAMGMGSFIADRALVQESNMVLVVVISHSRALFRQLLTDVNAPVHKIFVGDPDTSFDDWLNRPVAPYSIEQLLGIRDVGLKNFRSFVALNKQNGD